MSSSWNKDWLEAQRQYMEALAAFANTGPQNQGTGTHTPEWQKALDYWWQSTLTSIPPESQPVFSNLLQHSRNWYALSDQFNALLGAMTSDTKDDVDWQAILAQHINKMKTQVADGMHSAAGSTWQDPTRSPADLWQDMFKALSSTSTAVPGLELDSFQAIMDKVFSMSGAGAGGKTQEQIREGLRLWETYQSRYREYRTALDKLGLSALDRFRDKILAVADTDSPISSLRELYDLWVDAHEESYADYVLTEEYSLMYGQLVNAILAFRAHTQQLVSESSRALNLPTTEQQDALLDELLAIKQQQAADKQRLQLLEKKIRDLDKQASTGSKKKTRKKKATSKKVSGKKGKKT